MTRTIVLDLPRSRNERQLQSELAYEFDRLLLAGQIVRGAGSSAA